MIESTQAIELNDHEIVIQATRNCKHFNSNECLKGMLCAIEDYKAGHDFGATCRKMTHSFCVGYLGAWNGGLKGDGIEPIKRWIEA